MAARSVAGDGDDAECCSAATNLCVIDGCVPVQGDAGARLGGIDWQTVQRVHDGGGPRLHVRFQKLTLCADLPWGELCQQAERTRRAFARAWTDYGVGLVAPELSVLEARNMFVPCCVVEWACMAAQHPEHTRVPAAILDQLCTLPAEGVDHAEQRRERDRGTLDALAGA